MTSLAIIAFGLLGTSLAISVALIAPWTYEVNLILALVWCFGASVGIGAGIIGVSK